MRQRARAAGDKKAGGFEGSVGELDGDGEESDGAASEGGKDGEDDTGAADGEVGAGGASPEIGGRSGSTSNFHLNSGRVESVPAFNSFLFTVFHIFFNNFFNKKYFLF